MARADVNKLSDMTIMVGEQIISHLVVDCSIYHGVVDQSWSGSLAISDTSNLVSEGLISPGDEVKIILVTDNEEKRYEFLIYDISDKILLKESHYGYILKLATPFLISAQSTKIFRAFPNMKPTDILSQTVAEIGMKPGRISNSSNSVAFISTGFSPFYVMNLAQKYAMKNNTADFFWFQSDSDEISMLSLKDMKKDDTGIKLIQDNVNTLEKDGTHREELLLSIEAIQTDTHVNMLDIMQMGGMGNSIIQHDIRKGESRERSKENDPFETGYSSKDFIKTVTHSDETSLTPYGDPNWLINRKGAIAKLHTNTTRCTISGHAEAWEWLGRSLDIDIIPHGATGTKDKNLDGKHAIIGVRHNKVLNSFKTTLEILPV